MVVLECRRQAADLPADHLPVRLHHVQPADRLPVHLHPDLPADQAVHPVSEAAVHPVAAVQDAEEDNIYSNLNFNAKERVLLRTRSFHIILFPDAAILPSLQLAFQYNRALHSSESQEPQPARQKVILLLVS